jgi:hypothetical protein
MFLHKFVGCKPRRVANAGVETIIHTKYLNMFKICLLPNITGLVPKVYTLSPSKRKLTKNFQRLQFCYLQEN